MQTRTLGRTDCTVNAIGLGAMPLSLPGHPDSDTAFQVIKTFVESGGDFIDTANVYCPGRNDIGHNERLIISSLRKLGLEDEVKIATKGGLRRLNDNWSVDASPMWLRISCENSLTELRLNSIFLYQLHAPDPDIPFSDSIGELMRLKEQGLIQHIGLSNVSRKQLTEAMNLTEITSVQNRCNVFKDDDVSSGLVDFCRENGITYIAHSPVGGHYKHKTLMADKTLRHLAAGHDTESYNLALAWLLNVSSNILPIPGASRVTSVEQRMRAHDIKLDKEELDLLSQLK